MKNIPLKGGGNHIADIVLVELNLQKKVFNVERVNQFQFWDPKIVVYGAKV